MAYVPRIDFNWYSGEFRGGMENPPIDRNSWGYFERTSWNIINWRNADDSLLRIDNGDYPLYLKMCVCRIAEIEQERSKAPKVGEVTTERAFSYSYTIKDTVDKFEFDKQTRNAIGVYLFGTPLWNLLGHRGI